MGSDFNVQIMDRILDEQVAFYTDKDNLMEVFVEYPLHNGALAFEPISSRMFEAFLGYQYRTLSGDRVVPDFSGLLIVKEQDCQYEQARQVRIHRRVAGSLRKGQIAYFLSDPQWTTVLVKRGGWKIGGSKTLKFLKSPLDEAQTKPKPGGDLFNLLRGYVNLDDDDFKLFVIYLVQSFSRSSSHFAAVLSSAKGTGKTTLSKVVRAIVDPSKSSVAIMPSTESDLKTLLSNSYLACFDNTATLSTKFSNILCAAITGSKDAKRKLYTDCDQIILNLHNMVLLNGIDIVPYKSDLAERTLLFELKAIPKAQRKTDVEFWGGFNRDLPLILGAIFDTLVKAMELLPTVAHEGLHRMADANEEMLAIAMALGMSQTEFQQLLWGNNAKLQAAYAQNNPFVDAVIDYIRSRGKVDAPASRVYADFVNSVQGSHRYLPETPSHFSRKLNEEKDALLQCGIQFSRYKEPDANYIRLERIARSQQTKAQKLRSQHTKLLDDDASTED